jgi:hypothetical protein
MKTIIGTGTMWFINIGLLSFVAAACITVDGNGGILWLHTSERASIASILLAAAIGLAFDIALWIREKRKRLLLIVIGSLYILMLVAAAVPALWPW